MDISEVDFKRFKKCVLHGPSFQFMLVGVDSPEMREICIARINLVAKEEGAVPDEAIARLSVSAESHSLVPDFIKEVQKLNQAGVQVVHVIPAPDWLTQPLARALNTFREGIFHIATGCLVLWLTEAEIRCLSMYAPDLWSWRSGPYRMYEENESV